MVAVRRTLPAPPEVTGRWVAVFEEAGLRPKVLEVMDRYPELRSVEIPFPQIERADTALADLLLERPEEVIESGKRAMRELLPVAGPEAEGLRLRITQLPALAHRPIREIRESDLNHLIAIDGIVRKATEVRPQIREAVFSCNVCRAEIHEIQDDGSLVVREPIECSACGRPIGRTRFRLLAEKSVYIDGQRIEIQENPETLKGGAHPQGVTVLLTEDQTGRVIPGNRIVANGLLRSLQRATVARGGAVKSVSFDLVLLGNSVESKQQEFDEIEIGEEEERRITSYRNDPTVLDKIVLSLAPTIKGMEIEKRAIALQLFGGVEKLHSDGIRVRGDINILLLGDPGVGKSQLLRYVASIAPRGIYASGKGTTAAGLTAAAVKDDFAGGRWVLEAGLLVLADGGIAVIDELDKMTPEDRSAMHEALEQQTVSISKAGITATLNARCPVLAAANPKWGRFTNEEFASQVDLPPTLLSRFDVIFPIADRPDRAHDRTLARQILLSHQAGERVRSGGDLAGGNEAPFEPDFFRKYIAFARRNVRPVLSEEARSAIEEYYVRVRSEGERTAGREGEGPEQPQPVPITARQLEALVRLSEASARARLSPVVTALDSERAIGIVQAFLDRMTTAGGTAHDIDRVTTGMPREKQGQIETIMNLMRELQEEKGGRFTEEELVERAAKVPYSHDKVAYLLGYLKNVGEVMEVRPNVFQLVRFF